jgi:ABC-type polysaccharide/polyol phosphate transport system ATPase subunit
MSDVAIRGVDLSKRYAIGERARYVALRDILANMAKAPVRWFGSKASDCNSHEHIWALRDVSFEIREGEVVGLIGYNGAGKTTLLKILARVTWPTAGFAEVCGRMGTLLEVGTGFHPELTGRENVFLSGAILGMTKREIERKFDEMVSFAGVEQFIDTPLKHYSTGMQMRLAFGVAAHLEPEILLVDEVLAVGDAAFQKKCLVKMSDVARGGRTIVFVSHQMNQIRRLCQRVIWVDQGRLRADGPMGEVVAAYEASQMNAQEAPSSRCFLRWEIAEPRNGEPHSLTSHGPVKIKVKVRLRKAISRGHHGIALYNPEGQLVWATAVDNLQLTAGEHDFLYRLQSLPLRPGAYRWQVSLYDEADLVDSWECVPVFSVATQPLGHPRDEWAGFLSIPWEFKVDGDQN